jgi:hypothetical protein
MEHSAGFDLFLSYLEDADPDSLNPHWIPQRRILKICPGKECHIGTVERISEVFLQLELWSGRNCGTNWSIAPHSTDAERWIGEHMTASRKKRLSRIYEEDFDLYDRVVEANGCKCGTGLATVREWLFPS